LLPRVSEKEMVVLDLLAGNGAMYGLELVGASEGRLGRGTVYVTLHRMADKGYVTSEEEARPAGDPGPPRRLYRLTAHGRRVRSAWRSLGLKLAWDGP
jgi:DNA-binding PadR family transcriptional regulator